MEPLNAMSGFGSYHGMKAENQTRFVRVGIWHLKQRGWSGVGEGVGVLRGQGVLGFLVFGFKVSRFLGFKVSEFQEFENLPMFSRDICSILPNCHFMFFIF